MNRDSLRAATQTLLEKAGFWGASALTRIRGGANNRAFRVDTARGPFFLKAYFHHPDDERDRLAAEFSFSRYAWRVGLRCLPEPLACDGENRLGLYEYIDGREVEAHEVTPEAVAAAAEFLRGLNRAHGSREGLALPDAADASFSIHEHLQRVERRVHRLDGIRGRSGVEQEAGAFVRSEILPLWQDLRAATLARASREGLDPEVELHPLERCLSPSDFGFHNALVDRAGRFRFLDFEYAGWDDPAKTVCDFFCQPRLPVPREFLASFTRAAAAELSDEEALEARVRLLLPVHGLKWCCLLLNEFLPVAADRRRFAGEDPSARMRSQLDRSRRSFDAIVAQGVH